MSEEAEVEKIEEETPEGPSKVNWFLIGALAGAFVMFLILFVDPPKQTIKEWADAHDCSSHILPRIIERDSFYNSQYDADNPDFSGPKPFVTMYREPASTYFNSCTTADGTQVEAKEFYDFDEK